MTEIIFLKYTLCLKEIFFKIDSQVGINFLQIKLSVKEILFLKEVKGLLIGGASLEHKEFSNIAMTVKENQG